MKHVYLLETANYNSFTRAYQFYAVEIFSSKSKIDWTIDNRVNVNKGYDVIKESIDKDYCLITYKCLSTDDRDMKVRYRVRKLRVN